MNIGLNFVVMSKGVSGIEDPTPSRDVDKRWRFDQGQLRRLA